MFREKLTSYLRSRKILILIILLAFFLRALYLYDNLFFGWEQGRDFLKYKEILSGDLVLVGPKTDVDGLFHGALSYYLYLPLYIIFNGSPLFVLISLIFLNVLTCFFIFELAKDLFDKYVGYFASLFYAVSYSSIIYSRWLIHTNLIPFFAIAGLFFLNRAKDKSGYKYLFFISWGVLFHLGIPMSFTYLLFFLTFLIFRKVNFSKKELTVSLVIMLIFASPFLVFDVKTNGVIRNAVSGFINHSETFTSRPNTLDEFKNEIVDNIFPNQRSLSLVVFSLSIFYLMYKPIMHKNTLLILGLVLSVPIAFYLVSFKPLRHFYIYVSPLLSILLGLVVVNLFKTRKKFLAVLFTVLIVASNLHTLLNRLPESKSNFLYHSQRTYLGDQLALIDYVYTDAQGGKFSYDYFSVPYWKEEAWAYLFSWYGEKRYGYLPSSEKGDEYYLVFEPDESISLYQKHWYQSHIDHANRLDNFTSGKLIAEKWKRR